MLEDGAAPVVGASDGPEVAAAAALCVAACPLHAVVTNAAAAIEIASRRHAILARATRSIERIIRIPSMRSSVTPVGRTWGWESFDASPPEGLGAAADAGRTSWARFVPNDSALLERLTRSSRRTRRRDCRPAGASIERGRSPGMSAQTTVANGIDELSRALADDAGFESWYRRTLPRVYSYLVSRSGGDTGLAEELTQQTFIAAIDQRSRFDGRSDTITWLCGIARHKLADHFRAIDRDERRQMRMEVRQIELEERPRVGLKLEDREMIGEVLRSLPANQRAVLVFVGLDDLSVAEAARLIGRSRGATESLLFRARDSFRRAYAAENRDD